jgi:hypothetical protein
MSSFITDYDTFVRLNDLDANSEDTKIQFDIVQKNLKQIEILKQNKKCYQTYSQRDLDDYLELHKNSGKSNIDLMSQFVTEQQQK